MTIQNVIDMADVLRPNDVPSTLKVDALLRLDAEMAEFMDADCEVNGASTNLLVPYPYDYLYVSFMKAFIDNAQEDAALYANDMAEYQSDLDKFKAWHTHHYQRPQISGWRV